MPDASRFTVRAAVAADRAAFYRICLLTGDGGADASGLCADPELLGHVYVGPYLALQPQFAFALDDGTGAVGYVLGAEHTHDFEQECERTWWPGLRERYPAPEPGRRASWSRDEKLIDMIRNPLPTPGWALERHPSHLHIDLLPHAQGQGLGAQLIDRLLTALAAAGSPGVHLGVSTSNHRARRFYARVGFTELDAGPHGVLMGRPLPRALPTP